MNDELRLVERKVLSLEAVVFFDLRLCCEEEENPEEWGAKRKHEPYLQNIEPQTSKRRDQSKYQVLFSCIMWTSHNDQPTRKVHNQLPSVHHGWHILYELWKIWLCSLRLRHSPGLSIRSMVALEVYNKMPMTWHDSGNKATGISQPNPSNSKCSIGEHLRSEIMRIQRCYLGSDDQSPQEFTKYIYNNWSLVFNPRSRRMWAIGLTVTSPSAVNRRNCPKGPGFESDQPLQKTKTIFRATNLRSHRWLWASWWIFCVLEFRFQTTLEFVVGATSVLSLVLSSLSIEFIHPQEQHVQCTA